MGIFGSISRRVAASARSRRLSLFFHAAFLSLLISEALLTGAYLFSGYQSAVQRRTEALTIRVTALSYLLSSRADAKAQLLDLSSAVNPGLLKISQIDDGPLIRGISRSVPWDAFRTCRRSFSTSPLFDACVATIAPGNPKYQGSGAKAYDIVYLIAKVDWGRPLRKHTSVPLPDNSDFLRVQIINGDKSDQLYIVHQDLEKSDGEKTVTSTVFFADGKWRPLSSPRKEKAELAAVDEISGQKKPQGDMCGLVFPENEPNTVVYLCALNRAILKSFQNEKWPLNDRSQVSVRIEVLAGSENGKPARIAATFDDSSGTIVDRTGLLREPIAEIVAPLMARNVGEEIWIESQQLGLVSVSAQDTSVEANCSDLLCQIIDAGSRWVEAPKVNVDLPIRREIPGLLGATVMGRFDIAHAWPVYLQENRSTFIFLGALLSVTTLVYLLVFGAVLRRVRRLSRAAESAISDPTQTKEFSSVDRNNDEIGLLAAGFGALLEAIQDRIAKEQLRRKAAIEAQERALKAIGHEIRSPLQGLLAMTNDPRAQIKMKRIAQAVEHLYGAASPEEAWSNLPIRLAPADLAGFLTNVATYAEAFGVDRVVYEGPQQPVWAVVDLEALEDAVGHILNNGNRYRRPETNLVIHLFVTDDGEAVIDIDNEGPLIPEHSLKEIFEYGVTTGDSHVNLGQGLAVVKNYIGRMSGGVVAMNLDNGVRFRMVFRTAQSPEEMGALDEDV